MDPFLITLLTLLFVATVIGLLQTYRRDPCLHDFHRSHVTLAEQDGDLCWGRVEILSSGMEITYVDAVHAPEGHRATSFLFYKDQYEAMDALYRYVGKREVAEDESRLARLRRAAHPNLFRKLGRRLRNWIGMIRDALMQALGMVIGVVKTRSPGTAVLGSQETQIKALSKEVIGHVGNAFDPLLERHLFQLVVLEVTRNGHKTSYCGRLQNYSSRFIEVVDATNRPPDGTALRPLRPNEAGLDGLTLTANAGRLCLVNAGKRVYFVRHAEAADWKREMGCVVPPGYTADLALPPDIDAGALSVWVEVAGRIDIVAPRAHALVRHAALPPEANSPVTQLEAVPEAAL